LLKALGNVKEQIGEWHDWQQLAEIAHEVLHATGDRELLELIEKAGNLKLTRALAASNSFRRRFLRPARRRWTKAS
jgi:hypothetical protein